MSNHFESVLNFWFQEISPKQWWVKDLDFDLKVKKRFGELHNKAIKNELYTWRDNPYGSLAEIIVLDQFSRNIYRNDPRSFSYDSMALSLCLNGMKKHVDQSLPHQMKLFFYLPLMHSESKSIHELAITVFKEYGEESNLEFEYKHKEIIDRFGRYPHRNEILNRKSTPEEIEFLKGPNSSF